jgi:hypothetical protein
MGDFGNVSDLNGTDDGAYYLFDNSLETSGKAYFGIAFTINFIDLCGLSLLFFFWKYRNNPGIALRQPPLITFLVAYFVFYDWWITGDALNYFNTGGTPCSFWEWADDINYLLYLEILVVRGFALYLMFNRTVLLKKKRKGTLKFWKKKKGTNSGGDDDAGAKATAAISSDMLDKIRKYQKWTQPRFVLMVVFVLVALHTIPFAIMWINEPWYATTSFDEWPTECYTSVPYLFNFYIMCGIAAIALAVSFKLKLVKDNFQIRLELINLAASWTVYCLLNFAFGYLTEGPAVAQIAVYMMFLIYFYAMFLAYPLWKFVFHGSVQDSRHKSVDDEKDAFEALLKEEEFFEDFLKFVEGEYCAENLFFWKDAQEFKNAYGSSQQENLEMAKHIYDSYFAPNAETPVNIPGNELTRLSTLPFGDASFQVPKETYNLAEAEVLEMLYFGPYRRYRRNNPTYGKFRERLMTQVKQDIVISGLAKSHTQELSETPDDEDKKDRHRRSSQSRKKSLEMNVIAVPVPFPNETRNEV